MIVRAILTFAFVSMMMPNEPDLGVASPDTKSQLSVLVFGSPCGTTSSNSCDGLGFQALLGSIEVFESLRAEVLNGIDRVRSDFDANLTHPLLHASQLPALMR